MEIAASIFAQPTVAVAAAAGQAGVATSRTRFGMPVEAADAGKIRLGGAFRMPAEVADPGKLRLGGAFRMPTRRND